MRMIHNKFGPGIVEKTDTLLHPNWDGTTCYFRPDITLENHSKVLLVEVDSLKLEENVCYNQEK